MPPTEAAGDELTGYMIVRGISIWIAAERNAPITISEPLSINSLVVCAKKE
jgi:hypothetical protein